MTIDINNLSITQLQLFKPAMLNTYLNYLRLPINSLDKDHNICWYRIWNGTGSRSIHLYASMFDIDIISTIKNTESIVDILQCNSNNLLELFNINDWKIINDKLEYTADSEINIYTLVSLGLLFYTENQLLFKLGIITAELHLTQGGNKK